MIRQLGPDDADELVRVMDSNPKVQLNASAEHKRWFVYEYLVPHLSEPGRVVTLGEFDGDRLRAFVETRRWTDSDCDVTLGTTSADQSAPHALARGSRWPRAIIALVNAAVDLHRGQGRDVVWTTRPDDARWVPLTSASDCVLRDYTSSVECRVPANTPYPRGYSQVSLLMPTDQLVVRMQPTRNDGVT